ncbi:unnamed protein product [Clonostachys rhizophaga]|uniref:Vegetative incompatibility protein HET-E-1 n=1 Tax=Clonostachys rhizophaga TaxID=160324 RepID=A0A9N9W0W4_9HYPO|nr:unnamed protein product [Clonostachys rhizophaga]
MDANTPTENRWRRWARQAGCCLGDDNQTQEPNKPIPLVTVADAQNMPGIPATSTSSTGYANPLPTSPSPPERATTIYSNTTQGNTTQVDGESPPIASRINSGTSGAMAIEGSDAGPEDATVLGSPGPNKIDLWGKALGQIQQSQDKESAEMAEKFVQTLNGRVQSDPSGSDPFKSAKNIQIQMQESIAGKEAKTESDGWIITIGQKEYRVQEFVEKTTVILEKFAGTVSRFMGNVDVAVTYNPAHAALPWAAVRLALTVVIAAHEFKGRVAVGLAKVAVLISQCQIYQRFYVTSDISTELDRREVDSLEEAIITVYTQSLLFLAFAHKKSKMRALNASWKLSDLDGYFENLKDAGNDLVQAADNCQKVFEKRTGAKVIEVVELLKDFGATIYEQRELIVDIGQRALLSELKCADGANYNSAEDQAEPRCHKKTRIELLKAVETWMDTSEEKPIYWLQGNAGTGKSTISRTVAEIYDAKSKLGASFFFKRGRGDRASGGRFFTTISSQLCRNRPRFAQSVAKAISEDRSIVTANYTDQLKKLILEPIKALARDPNNCASILIVVDALDECEEDTHMQIMIQSLGQIKKLKECGVDLRLFITSRPEAHIRRGFQEILDCQKEVVLHDISGDVIQQDITIYLKDELAQIRNRHNKAISQFGQPIEEDWPGDERIKRLAQIATPLFIFAATVCRLLDCDNPREEIDRIVSPGQKPHDQTLDGAYEAALGRILKGKENSSTECRIVGNFRVVVGSIVLLEEPLSVSALAQLLSTSPETVLSMVTSVSSVLNVPRDEKTPVKTFHLSFSEFLVNKQRNKSPKLQIDKEETHRDLADKCLKLLLKSGILKNDICELGKLDTRNQDVTQNTIDDKLPPQVQYACRYWVHHTKKGNVKLHNKHPAYEFLKKHFLHWLEVLSLIGRVSETIGLIRELQELVDLNSGEKVSEFLHDANRFLLHSFTAISQTPLQLYASALLFAPTNSIVRNFFEDDISWVKHKPTVEKDWSPCLQTMDHQSWGSSVSVSRNGKLIACGSYGGGVKVWDASTGVLQKTLETKDMVASVTFSGSKLITARSRDGTIRIWNTETGRLQHTLQGNSDDNRPVSNAFSLASSNSGLIASLSYNGILEIWDASTGELRKAWKGYEGPAVLCLSFRVDGKLVASGSNDRTVKVWDAATGELQHTLTGHKGWVRSVAFSSDGSLLASASNGRSIRVWDAKTWQLQGTLQGHDDYVTSVAFSHDCKILASGSYDNTIKIWNLATKTLHHTLAGHGGIITSMAFPENNNLLVSASDDKTIKIRDITKVKPQSAFESRNRSITSVAFLGDGTLVASVSDDRTIKVWDGAIGLLKYTLNGHQNYIDSVVLSADSKLIASASHDETIKVWDAENGSLKCTMEGHNRPATTVAFSADNNLIASISLDDETVKVWDAANGSARYTKEGYNSMIHSVTFLADDKLIAIGLSNGTVETLDAANGSFKYRLESRWGTLPALSTDSKLMATSPRYDAIEIRDAANGLIKYTLKDPYDLFNSVAFSADNKLIASASRNKTVKIWDIKEGKVKKTIHTDENYKHLSFSSINLLMLQEPGHIVININKIPENGEAQVEFQNNMITEPGANDLPEIKPTSQHAVVLQPHGCSLSLEAEWVMWNGQKVVWLPPDCRPNPDGEKCYTISASGEMIAIGSSSGRLCLMGGFKIRRAQC